jgi:hypothetical protein
LPLASASGQVEIKKTGFSRTGEFKLFLSALAKAEKDD